MRIMCLYRTTKPIVHFTYLDMKNRSKHDNLMDTHYYIKVGTISHCDTSHDNETHVSVPHNRFN